MAGKYRTRPLSSSHMTSQYDCVNIGIGSYAESEFPSTIEYDHLEIVNVQLSVEPMAHRVYTIGRSEESDVVFSDNSVSRHHAELVLGRDGALYLTDCASSHGTFVKSDNQWVAVRQMAVSSDDHVRIAGEEMTVGQLVTLAKTKKDSIGGKNRGDSQGDAGASVEDLIDGSVKRNSKTGEVVSKN